MKKLFTIICLCISIISISQETNEKNQTEIKFNALSTSLGTVEFEFERTINSKSSFGLSFFNTFNESGKAFSFDYDSGITGFYRRYFGKKYASGLFLEGFGMFHSTKYLETNNSVMNIKQDQINDLLIGLGIGYKWVSKKGIILQANFGIGRNLFESPEKIGGRVGISIGYRF